MKTEILTQVSNIIDEVASTPETEKIRGNSIYGALLLNLFDALSKDESTNAKQFIIDEFEKYKEIQSDVISSFENPTCSCRGRFSNFIQNNKEICKNILLKTILENEIEEAALKKLSELSNLFLKSSKSEKPPKKENIENKGNIEATIQKNTQIVVNPAKDNKTEDSVNLIGKSILIQKTPESFQMLLTLIGEKVKYNEIHITEDAEKLKVTFY